MQCVSIYTNNGGHEVVEEAIENSLYNGWRIVTMTQSQNGPLITWTVVYETDEKGAE